jgi:integrase
VKATLNYLLVSSRRSSTLATYTNGLNNITQFLAEAHLLVTVSATEKALPPITPVLLTHYLAWLYRAEYAYNTILSYITAVRAWCRLQGRPDPALTPTLPLTNGTPNTFLPFSEALQSVKRLSSPPKAKFAVTLDQLTAIVSLSSRSSVEATLGLNIAAAASLAWFALLRVSEYTVTASASFDVAKHACRSDVTFGPTGDDHLPTYLDFHCKDSKNSLIREPGFTARVYRSGSDTCAVLTLWSLFTHDPQPLSSPLFDFRTAAERQRKTNCTPRRSQFVSIISKVLCASGFNDHGISSHSFRRGGATALARGGATEAQIMHAGRWRSGCWQSYIIANPDFSAGLTRLMVTSRSMPGMHWSTAPPFHPNTPP